MQSRRNFLTGVPGLAVASTLPAFALPSAASESFARKACLTQEVSLDGEWLFRLDPEGGGEAHHWQQAELSGAGWTIVTVPHTWQVMPAAEEYRGQAWYRRTFDAPKDWEFSAVRIEFEAVFHSVTVWVNG